jgi:hemerythrin-like domain-containing protein
MASSPLGYSAPSAGFDAPLEMLGACHERIKGQCSTLRRLAAHVVAAGADDDARAAAHNVIRYFDSAGRHHHEDEEHDLFPALLEATAGSEPTGIRQLVDALKLDHRALDAGWQKLRPWLARIEAGDASAPAQEEIERFIDRYARHIAREERDLLPMAAQLLGPGALERIGQSMRQRRGVGPGPGLDPRPSPGFRRYPFSAESSSE